MNSPLFGNVDTLVIGNFVMPGGIQINSFPDYNALQVSRVAPTPPPLSELPPPQPPLPPAPSGPPTVRKPMPEVSFYDKVRFENIKRYDNIDLTSPGLEQDCYAVQVRKAAFECNEDWKQAIACSKGGRGENAAEFVSLSTMDDCYDISFRSAEALCEFMECIDVIFVTRKTYNLYYKK